MSPKSFTLIRHLGCLVLFSLALGTLSSCSWFQKKDDDLAPPIYKPKPPVDPVEQRIFYSGWRHPN